jgi:hypothetical protein
MKRTCSLDIPAKLINNNGLTESELWQLLLDALMIHFKDHNAKMLEVSDTSFTYELTFKYLYITTP